MGRRSLLVSIWLGCAFLGMLWMNACSGGPAKPTSTTVQSSASSTVQSTIQSTTSGNSTLTWTVIDGCSDGLGFQFKFFDETHSLVWPSSTTHYTTSIGGTTTEALSCQTGARVCYGARTDPTGTSYWGVDIDNSKGCDSCCTTCSTASTSVRLTCS